MGRRLAVIRRLAGAGVRPLHERAPRNQPGRQTGAREEANGRVSEWIVRPQVIGARPGRDGRNQAAWSAVRLVVVSAVIAVVAWPITGSRPLTLDGSFE